MVVTHCLPSPGTSKPRTSSAVMDQESDWAPLGKQCKRAQPEMIIDWTHGLEEHQQLRANAGVGSLTC